MKNNYKVLYSPEQKRKIILDNYNYPDKQVELEKLKEKSEEWQVPFSTFRSLDSGCGDIIYLLIKKKNDCIEKCYFSAQQSCLVTVSVANIICDCLEGMKDKTVQELVNNFCLMLENKEYNLNDYPKLQVFSDISRFPNRLECVRLVIRGVTRTLK